MLEASENGSGSEDENEIIFEKFFISQDSDLSSQSLAYLELGRTSKQKSSPDTLKLLNYAISQNHEFMSVFTTDNTLYTFKVADLVFKEQQQQN